MEYKGRTLHNTSFTKWNRATKSWEPETWKKAYADDITVAVRKQYPNTKDFIIEGGEIIPLEQSSYAHLLEHPELVTSVKEANELYLTLANKGHFTPSVFMESYTSNRTNKEQLQIFEKYWNEDSIFGFGWKYAIRVLKNRFKEKIRNLKEAWKQGR